MNGKIKKVINWTIVIIFAVIIVASLIQVVLRYLFNAPLMWEEEFVRYLYVWGIMIAVAVVFAEGGHIAIDLLKNKLPRVMKLWVEVLIFLIIGVISAALFYYGLQYVFKAGNSMSPALGIPMTYAYLAIPAGSLLILVLAGVKIVKVILLSKKAKQQQEE